MRMHRGSSKEVGGRTLSSEPLPLSASRVATVTVIVEVIRAGQRDRQRVELPDGALVRHAVHAVGLFPEATSVLVEGCSVPLDRPLRPGESLQVVRTFSGG